jgi:transposase
MPRWRIEAAFCRLKDFQRVATRYGKLAANPASAVTLAVGITFCCWLRPDPKRHAGDRGCRGRRKVM